MNPKQPWNILRFTGTRTINSITNKATTAVVDAGYVNGEKAVYFQTAATHYLTAGSAITIGGATTKYKGTYKTLAGTATDKIYIPHRYEAETLTTTTTFKVTLAPKVPFEFGGFRLHLSAQATTAESLTITLDAGAGAVYDHLLFTYSMNTTTDMILIPPTTLIKDSIAVANWGASVSMEFQKDDELDFAWGNTNTKTYGLEVLWRAL